MLTHAERLLLFPRRIPFRFGGVTGLSVRDSPDRPLEKWNAGECLSPPSINSTLASHQAQVAPDQTEVPGYAISHFRPEHISPFRDGRQMSIKELEN